MKNAHSIGLLLALLLCQTTSAQVSLGLRAGTNYSTIADMSSSAEAGLLGAAKGWGGSIALFARVSLSDRVSLETELGLSIRRTKLHHEYTESFSFGGSQRIEIDNEMRFNYLEVPVIMSVRVIEGFHVHLGPQYAHLLGGTWKEEWTATGANGFGDPFVDRETTKVEGSKVIGRRSPSEFGLVLGGDYLWSNGIGLCARYLKSFSYVETGESEYLYGRFSVLTFSLTYAFIRPSAEPGH